MMAAIVPLLCSTVAPRAAVARWLSHRSAIHNLHCLAATTDRAVDLAERACSPEPPQFTAVRDETQERWPGGAHMVSGMQQGRLLHMLVRLSRATRVLEVGSFSGYAALWMALALPEGGKLVSLERDERAADVARRHLDASGVGERVDLVLGDAMEYLHAARGVEEYELIVWRDQADAPSTARLLHHAASLLAPHGLLVLQHASPPSDAVVEALVQEARDADQRMRVVTLPSPDGERGNSSEGPAKCSSCGVGVLVHP